MIPPGDWIVEGVGSLPDNLQFGDIPGGSGVFPGAGFKSNMDKM